MNQGSKHVQTHANVAPEDRSWNVASGKTKKTNMFHVPVETCFIVLLLSKNHPRQDARLKALMVPEEIGHLAHDVW